MKKRRKITKQLDTLRNADMLLQQYAEYDYTMTNTSLNYARQSNNKTRTSAEKYLNAMIKNAAKRRQVSEELVERVPSFVALRYVSCRRTQYTLCSKKSDAKIEITITTTNLIRIKYPLSTFNYHRSGANIANFNKIHGIVFEQQLF